MNTYKRRRGEKGNDSAFSVRFIASIDGQDISHFPAGRSTVLWRRDERREREKKNVINGYVRRQSQVDSAIIAQGNGHLRSAGLVSIARTRAETRAEWPA